MWDELQAVAEVVRCGTVSAAANELGIHRATIHRRISTLEEFIGCKLFQRHKNGYTPTEIARDLLPIADNMGEQLQRLRRRALSQEETLKGDLIITSIDGLAPFVLNKIAEFTALHPEISIKFLASNERLQLELGEAHIAMRLGARPVEPDYVVLPFGQIDLGLYASEDYIARYGMPTTENLSEHRFVLPNLLERESDPPEKWLRKLVDRPDFVLRVDKTAVADAAIKAGVGVGFMPTYSAQESHTLVEVMPPKRLWQVNSWIVTHMDLHRSPKIQAFLNHCR